MFLRAWFLTPGLTPSLNTGHRRALPRLGRCGAAKPRPRPPGAALVAAPLGDPHAAGLPPGRARPSLLQHRRVGGPARRDRLRRLDALAARGSFSVLGRRPERGDGLPPCRRAGQGPESERVAAARWLQPQGGPGAGELPGEAASQRERGACGALLGQREALREQEGQGSALAHGAQRLHRRLLALGGADWRTERVRWPAAEPREGLLRAGGERERVVAPDRHCEEEVVVVTRSLVCTR